MILREKVRQNRKDKIVAFPKIGKGMLILFRMARVGTVAICSERGLVLLILYGC